MEFVIEAIQEIANIIDTYLYSTPMLMVQFFSLVLSVVLFAFWVKLHKRAGILKYRVEEVKKAFGKDDAVIPKEKILSKWQNIEERMASNNPSDWKVAIIAADSLLDELIKSLGYAGDTMGERMKQLNPGNFPNLDDAWRVHKVRNFLAHDADYELRRNVADRAINIYKNIFKEFGME